MSTSLDFIEYVCEQIAGVGPIRYRKMFGEYMVYVNERFSYLTIRLSKAINIVASTLRAYYMWGVIF